MKNIHLVTTSILSLISTFSISQTTTVVNLHKAVKNNNIEVVNRELALLDEDGHQGIRLSKAFGEGVAWLKDIEFSNGIIEFDVRGEDVKQHSFVGLAFHGQNDSTFDAVYLRPFHFKTQDTILQHRMIQYISLPEFTWRKLREKFPNKFEDSIVPAPDPNAWVRMRIDVSGATISMYINGSKTPSLVVEKVNNYHRGAVGFYVADTSGGDFANISITEKKIP